MGNPFDADDFGDHFGGDGGFGPDFDDDDDDDKSK